MLTKFTHHRHFYFYAHLAVLAALLLIFALLPRLDLWVSGLFYRPADGFYLQDAVFAQVIYRGTRYVAALLMLGLLALVVATCWARYKKYRRSSWFCLVAVLLSAGLVVDLALKNHWQRSRPRDVVEFGGSHTFTPFYQIGTHCRKNCSFVSGHAAAGFSLLIFAYLLPRWRKKIWLAATLTGLGIGAVRVMMGGHFLSDILFCYFVMVGSIHLSYLLFGARRCALEFGAPTRLN